MKTIATFGSCRVSLLDTDDFDMVMGPVRNSPERHVPPRIYRREGVTVFSQPCGYSLTTDEHLDLVEVFCGLRQPLLRSNRPYFQEVHKYSPNPLVTGASDLVDTYIFEFCTRKVICNTDTFRNLSGWQGRTIPYKIMTANPSTYGVDEKLVKYNEKDDQGYLKVDRDRMIRGFKELLGMVKRSPSDIHVLGPYWWEGSVKSSDPSIGDINMPQRVVDIRTSLHEDVKAACEVFGIRYHLTNDIIGVGAHDGVLSNAHHFSEKGVRNFTTFVNQIASGEI